MDTIDHVYSMYIKASPGRVWRAITDGDDTVRYYYGTRVASDWARRRAARYTYPDGSIAADGVLDRARPERHDVVPSALGPEIEAEGPVRMTWDGRAGRGRPVEADGHQRPQSPDSNRRVSSRGGVVYIVSGLKTLARDRASPSRSAEAHPSDDPRCGRRPARDAGRSAFASTDAPDAVVAMVRRPSRRIGTRRTRFRR